MGIWANVRLVGRTNRRGLVAHRALKVARPRPPVVWSHPSLWSATVTLLEIL